MKIRYLLILLAVVVLVSATKVTFFSGTNSPIPTSSMYGKNKSNVVAPVARSKEEKTKRNEIVLKVKNITALNAVLNKEIKNNISLFKKGRDFYVIKLAKGEDAAKLAAKLAKYKNIAYAEPNYPVSLATVNPNDTYADPNSDGNWTTGAWGQTYEDLWGLKDAGFPSAWETTTGSGNVVVATIDTGLDMNHLDIINKIWANNDEMASNELDDDGNEYIDDVKGWDFVNYDNNPQDDNGHGTHVAGIIGAQANNNLGVAGACWGCKIMPLKVLDASGDGYASDLAEAIEYAADNGAKVINMSLAGIGAPQVIQDAVNYAHGKGVLLVAAAGNDNQDVVSYFPANMANVMAVAAVDRNGGLASFSNWGSKIDVAAPGVNILSLRAIGTSLTGIIVNTNYVVASGTSMAAPFVSGLAGLICSHEPDWSIGEVRQAIKSGAQDIGDAGWDINFGIGKIVANNSLGLAGVLQANISSPGIYGNQEGEINIIGTAAGEGFVDYSLEYGIGAIPTSWTEIVSSDVPVEDNTLASLDVSDLLGYNTLRLQVHDGADHTYEARVNFLANDVSQLYSTTESSSSNIVVGRQVTITVNLRDSNNTALANRSVVLSSSRTTDTLTQPSATTDGNGQAIGYVRINRVGASTIRASVSGVALADIATVSGIRHATGTVLKGSGYYYMIDGSIKRRISSYATRKAWKPSLSYTAVSSSVLANYTTGSRLKRMVRGSTTAYFYANGVRYPIADRRTLGEWGYKWTSLTKVSGTLLSKYSKGRKMYSAVKSPSGKVYVTYGGSLRYAGNKTMRKHWGISSRRVTRVSNTFIRSIAKKSKLTRLAKGSGRTVYYMENGKRRPIAGFWVYSRYHY